MAKRIAQYENEKQQFPKKEKTHPEKTFDTELGKEGNGRSNIDGT